MRNFWWAAEMALIGTFFGSSFAHAAADGAPQSLFDTPSKTVRVPLPKDPDNPQAKPEVKCAYYRDFAVKQIDLGEEGAWQLSILPPNAKCQKGNSVDESVVSANAWTGYFGGVKGKYVFFDAEDGWNDGMGFAIFTRGGKKIFDDVARKWTSIELTPTGIVLRYERVYGASCSLQLDGAACWAKIRRDTGLTQNTPPDCKAAYEKEQKRVPKFAKQTLADPTVIDYPVTVTIADTSHTMSPLTGDALGCRPAD